MSCIDYKILTNDEYQLLRTPLDQSTPTAEGGARPKVRNPSTVKFEPQEHNQPSHSDTCSGFVFDSSTVRPRFSVFSGEEKNETAFDVWKSDVQCALKDGACATHIILQAITSSLKGKARSLLLTLPTNATPQQILSRLDGVYGNIYPSEKLIQQFYASKQEEGETVVDFGMRLESILQRCIERKAISNDVKNEMLRTKLWSGLSDNNLRNASRYKYDTINDFETLRKELRTIELDMKLSAPSSS
ncbi:paraneoplastic antigen Ma2 homolog [Saccostrea echinata]|uniref:paraneoplastic antigen Ma2 homolog n=1 Tax=Saccostrea echinata TaxID=191078 RepID=UPI002A811A09|nr:paraneoplastic antigen Ma2 homolog [Saccostrea echinata]